MPRIEPPTYNIASVRTAAGACRHVTGTNLQWFDEAAIHWDSQIEQECERHPSGAAPGETSGHHYSAGRGLIGSEFPPGVGWNSVRYPLELGIQVIGERIMYQWEVQFDWEREWRLSNPGCHMSMVVGLPTGHFYSDEPGDAEIARRCQVVAEEIRELVGADAAYGDGVDLGLGASWEGIGIALKFAAPIVGAVTGVWRAAPQIHRAIRDVKRRFGRKDWEPMVALSIEVLQALVIGEIREKEAIDVADIDRVETITHSRALSESRAEVRQVYSAYTITVEAELDGFLNIWTYVVTSDGTVVSSSCVRLPRPNVTRWSDSGLPSRKLLGL